MKTSKRGIDQIKKHEALRLVAYPDPASPRAIKKRATGIDDRSLSGSPWTVGFGHTGDVKEGDVITEHQAEAILDVDVDRAERIVLNAVKVPLTQGQFDALVSFVFNVGPGKKGVKDGFVELKSGKPSSMLRKLNEGDYAGAAAEFMSWKFAAGRVMPGLVKRRAEEAALFKS